ncbi:unnamed protein product [[Candida] boidinii]|nr:unnamed protein product [[Candida] boidinii]
MSNQLPLQQQQQPLDAWDPIADDFDADLLFRNIDSMPAEIQDAVPDIIIGGSEEPVDELVDQVESDEEVFNEESIPVTEGGEKAKKSVSFADVEQEEEEEDLESEEIRRQKEFEEGGGLPEQPENPDFSKLTPTSPEIINRQATINIGTIGHVAHGKSTVVRAISGVQTIVIVHSNQIKKYIQNVNVKVVKVVTN